MNHKQFIPTPCTHLKDHLAEKDDGERGVADGEGVFQLGGHARVVDGQHDCVENNHSDNASLEPPVCDLDAKRETGRGGGCVNESNN